MSSQPLTGRAPSIPVYHADHRSPAVAVTALSVVFGLVIPLGLLIVLQRHGLDFSRPLYALLLAAVIVDAVLMAIAGITTMRGDSHPPIGVDPPPVVSVIVLVPAGTGSEAISVTTDAIRAQQYAGEIEATLVYAADQPVAVMDGLDAERNQNRAIRILRVDTLTTEADMIEAALSETHTDIVGFYRAGQDPAPDTVDRARRWIDAGCDAVFGHRAIVNAANSASARTIAVEQQTADVVRWAPEDERDGGLGEVSGSFWRTSPAHFERDDEASRASVRVRQDRRSITWEAIPTTHTELRARWAAQESAWMRIPDGPAIPRYAGRLPRWIATAWRPGYLWLSPMVPMLAVFWLGWQRVGNHGLRDLWPLLGLLVLWLCANPMIRTVFAYASAPSTERRAAWCIRYAFLTMLHLDTERRTIARAVQLQVLLGRTVLQRNRYPTHEQDVVALSAITVPAEGKGSATESVPIVLSTATVNPAVKSETMHPSTIAASAEAMIDIVSQLANQSMLARETVARLEERLAGCERARSEIGLSATRVVVNGESLSVEEIDTLYGVAQHLAHDPESLLALAAVSEHAQSLLTIVDALISARSTTCAAANSAPP